MYSEDKFDLEASLEEMSLEDAARSLVQSGEAGRPGNEKRDARYANVNGTHFQLVLADIVYQAAEAAKVEFDEFDEVDEVFEIDEVDEVFEIDEVDEVFEIDEGDECDKEVVAEIEKIKVGNTKIILDSGFVIEWIR